MAHPLVTIVTPSFNQAPFLRQAIDSVLGQDYEPLEYWVIDGGSTDGSVEILESYGDRLSFISEPDGGQAQAINKGLRRARGEVVAWLNSDDLYRPGAIAAAVRLFEPPNVGLVYGRGDRIDARGRHLGCFEELEPFRLWRLLYCLDYILQPATFFRRDAVASLGYLDEGLDYAMDWDLWIRLAAATQVRFLDRVLAGSREYADTKTRRGGWTRIAELGRVTRRHTGRFWTPGVQLYALDTLRRQVSHPPAAGRLVARLVAALSRRIQARLPVHADGWLGPQGVVVVPGGWRWVELVLEAVRLPGDRTLTVSLRTGGSELAVLHLEEPGCRRCRLQLAGEAAGGFVSIEVRSDSWFRSDPASGDRRRRSIRCLGISGGVEGGR